METVSQQLIDALDSTFQSMYDCAEAPHLPHFFIDETADIAWAAVLGSRKRVADLADKFRRLKIDTYVPRKLLRLQSDGIVLGLCYAHPHFQAQIDQLLPEQQAESLSTLGLTRSLIPTLLGDDHDIWQHIHGLGLQQVIQDRLIATMPFSAHAFSFGWGKSVYEILAYLPLLIKVHQEAEINSKTFYQAAFAITGLANQLKATHIPKLLVRDVLRQEESKLQNSYAGVSGLKIFSDMQAIAHGANPLLAAISLSDALGSLHRQINDGCPSDVLYVMETLHTMWGPGKQGFRIAAEEVVNKVVRHDLNKAIERCLGILTVEGVKNEWDEVLIPMDEFDLNPLPPSVETTAQHVKILSPLWYDVDYQEGFDNLNLRLNELESSARRVTSLKREIADLTSQAIVDALKIGTVANTLGTESQEFSNRLKFVIDGIKTLSEMCKSVQLEWNAYSESTADTPHVTAPNLSTSASVEDKEILSLAMDEAAALRGELLEARKVIHTLKSQKEARESLSAQASRKLDLSPDVLRKAVQAPRDLTPGEVLVYLSAIAGERVRVLPSAWRSAEDSKHFEYSDRLIAMLDKLVFSYAPELASGVPDSEARRHFGNAYSAKESETVTLDASMRKERTFQLDGVEQLFVRHLSIGNDPGAVRGMRVYFEIMDGQVVIAYCGKHLSVVSSN